MPAGNREDTYKAVQDDATPVSIIYYHTDSYKKHVWIFDSKKPANPHRNLITLDYQCVTNDPVAPSRMRTQSTRNRGDAYHRPACGYTSSWRVKPLDAHQPVTPETLTKAARDTISP